MRSLIREEKMAEREGGGRMARVSRRCEGVCRGCQQSEEGRRLASNEHVQNISKTKRIEETASRRK